MHSRKCSEGIQMLRHIALATLLIGLTMSQTPSAYADDECAEGVGTECPATDTPDSLQGQDDDSAVGTQQDDGDDNGDDGVRSSEDGAPDDAEQTDDESEGEAP
jgi:hypothetical protein